MDKRFSLSYLPLIHVKVRGVDSEIAAGPVKTTVINNFQGQNLFLTDLQRNTGVQGLRDTRTFVRYINDRGLELGAFRGNDPDSVSQISREECCLVGQVDRHYRPRR